MNRVPDGHEHWNLRMLASKLVELGVVESISHEKGRRVLKKTISNRDKRKCGAYPRPMQSMLPAKKSQTSRARNTAAKPSKRSVFEFI
jgi:hypothetical protein